MSEWIPYDNGQTIGKSGREGGVIVRDEEHGRGGRMTIKQSESFVSVSCSIYGWIDHTRFFNSMTDAQREYVLMKNVVTSMLDDILAAGSNDLKMWEAIADFVRRFP